MQASAAKFKNDLSTFEVRDTLRFQSIFDNSHLYKPNPYNNKANQVDNLLKKKHHLDKTVQLSLERSKDNETYDFDNNKLFGFSFNKTSKFIKKQNSYFNNILII